MQSFSLSVTMICKGTEHPLVRLKRLNDCMAYFWTPIKSNEALVQPGMAGFLHCIQGRESWLKQIVVYKIGCHSSCTVTTEVELMTSKWKVSVKSFAGNTLKVGKLNCRIRPALLPYTLCC